MIPWLPDFSPTSSAVSHVPRPSIFRTVACHGGFLPRPPALHGSSAPGAPHPSFGGGGCLPEVTPDRTDDLRLSGDGTDSGLPGVPSLYGDLGHPLGTVLPPPPPGKGGRTWGGRRDLELERSVPNVSLAGLFARSSSVCRCPNDSHGGQARVKRLGRSARNLRISMNFAGETARPWRPSGRHGVTLARSGTDRTIALAPRTGARAGTVWHPVRSTVLAPRERAPRAPVRRPRTPCARSVRTSRGDVLAATGARAGTVARRRAIRPRRIKLSGTYIT